MEKIDQVAIIGSGPAGLTAALYCARANLAPLVFMGAEPGGQLTTTTEVENFPGFPEGIQGPELMERMEKQAERFGAQLIRESVSRIDFSAQPHTVWAGTTKYQSRAVIIATGASTRWLGLQSETRLRGHGVSSCATCDGAFFRDKKIAVIGGGDSAMEEALFLTKFARSVTIIHRRAELRASKIMAERARNHPKIDFVWNAQVAEVIGETRVSGIKLKNVETGALTEFSCEGVFVAIGHLPNTKIFADFLELDAKGYIVTQNETHTKVPGVFVAGDVHDFRYRQAVTAAGSGCKAAIDAEKWLEE